MQRPRREAGSNPVARFASGPALGNMHLPESIGGRCIGRVRGTGTDVKIVLDGPTSWPYGTEVELRSARRDVIHSSLYLRGYDLEAFSAWVTSLESLQILMP